MCMSQGENQPCVTRRTVTLEHDKAVKQFTKDLIPA